MDDLTEDIVDLTIDLMGYRTTKPNQEERRECVDRIEKYFDGVNVETCRHEVERSPSLVVTYDGTSDPEYMLHGHIDVVSVDDDETWEPQRRDGKLYGRGAADMKGGVAAMMRLVKDLATEDRPSLGLMVTSDEETGGFDGARHLMNEGVYDPSFALSAEPDTRGSDGIQVVHQQKGVYWVEVAAFGETAHGSRPWKGKNAVELAWEWYDAVEGMFERSDAEDAWNTTVNLGSLQGGGEFNKVPGTASLKLDIRYTDDLQPDEMLAEMLAVEGLSVETAADVADSVEIDVSEASAEEVGRALDRSERPDVLVRIEDDTPAMYTDPDHEYVQRLRDTIEATTGHEAVVERETGASDMAFFSGNGVPCVVFGPHGDQLHKPGEHLEIESLQPFYDVVREFVTADGDGTSPGGVR